MNGSERAPVAWSVGAACAALCTAFLAFYTRLPQVADEQLALPIARAVADPALYPATDLLVSSGLRGPFHFYRLAGALYTHGANVDAWWYAILVAALFATFLAIWVIAKEITVSATLAAVVTAVVAAASPYRGSLHWFLLPPPNLVTSTLATPLALAALALALRGHAGPGLVVAALTFNVHPAIGLATAWAIAIAMIASRSMGWRRQAAWWTAAAVCAAPNAVYVALRATENFSGPLQTSALSFADQFALYAHHAFIQDHWQENYGWFVLQLGGLFGLRRFMAADVRRMTLALAAALVALALLWLTNLYTLNYPAITLAFAIRGVAFVKPLAFAGIAVAMTGWYVGTTGRARGVAAITGTLLLGAALHKNLDIGEGIAAVAWGSVVLFGSGIPRVPRVAIAALLACAGIAQILGQGWGVLGVSAFTPQGVDAARLATIGAAALMLASVPWWTAGPTGGTTEQPGSGHRQSVWTAVAASLAVIVATLVLRGRIDRLAPASPATIAREWRLAEPDTAIADLVRWAPRGTPPGSLFAVPPVDDRFTVFRLATGRGVYALLGDVNQVAYDAAQYGAAHTRLIRQGVRVIDRHEFDASAWNVFAASRLAALAHDGVDYAVFAATERAAHPLPYPVVYKDPRWIVYDTRSAR